MRRFVLSLCILLIVLLYQVPWYIVLLVTSCFIISLGLLLPYIPAFPMPKLISGQSKRDLPGDSILINGTVAPGFDDVLDVFRHNFESGVEPYGNGSAFAAYYNGEKVVDLWGGYADREAWQPWKENTLTAAMSCTKGVTAICIAMLVERGQLDYDEKVSHYWPEFAQNGKGNITVRMLMNHEAGLAIVSRKLSNELLSNFSELGKVFEESTPIWEPGTARGYRMVTLAEIASQLLYRVDPKHRTVGQFFKEDIAEPFDLDFYIGLPYAENYRTARLHFENNLWSLMKPALETHGGLKFVWNEARKKCIFREVLAGGGDTLKMLPQNNPDFRAVEKPSSLGIGTARALAKLFDIVLRSEKGPDGKPLLSQETVHSLYDVSNWEAKFDVVGSKPSAYNVGLEIFTKSKAAGISFGHCGQGGQMSFAHPEMNMTSAYLTRTRSFYSAGDDPRWQCLIEALSKCASKIQASEGLNGHKSNGHRSNGRRSNGHSVEHNNN